MIKVAFLFVFTAIALLLYQMFFDKKVSKSLKVIPVKKDALEKIFRPIDFTEGVEIVTDNTNNSGLPRTAANF